jgi:hypothetical protein
LFICNFVYFFYSISGISALYDETELMDSSLNNAGGEEFSSHPDLARAVYFSGYPNYPPELTRTLC